MTWTKRKTQQEIEKAEAKISELEQAKLLLSENDHGEAISAINICIDHWRESIVVFKSKK
jgi:hypothetical protein